MNKCNKQIGYVCLVLGIVAIAGCSSSDDTTSVNPYSYATTSSKGDYSEWTLTGAVLNATLDVVNSTGGIDYTHTINATCGSADSFGVRSCTVVSSSCSAGAAVCPAAITGSFDIMDVPGVALYVHIGSGSTEQLHIGFAKDSTACAADVSGDYTMIRTGLGLNENFGVYRSDANFISISHADFGFDTADANLTDQSVTYRTGSGIGTGEEALINDGCVDGVRSRIAGSETIRSMMTASGLFVMDFPAGQGGLVSFKTSNAATLADFASKSFGGISFPDDAPAEPIKAEFGAVTGSQIEITATVGTDTQNLNIKTLATPASMTDPAYPNFSVVPADYGANVLSADYANPVAIPGMFKLDNLGDSGRVMLAAMKFGGKVIAVGMVYNYRTTFDTNPATGAFFDVNGLYNTGNFLIFEK